MIIHGLGDESTLGWKYSLNSNISKQYKSWLDSKFNQLYHEDSYLPLKKNVWIENLSNKLKCDFNLLAKEGSTNLDIFNSFVSNLDSFKEGDVVIINWTNNYKFNVYTDTKVHSISNVYDYTSVKEYINP